MTVPVRPASPGDQRRAYSGGRAVRAFARGGLIRWSTKVTSAWEVIVHEEGEDPRNDAERRLNGGVSSRPATHRSVMETARWHRASCRAGGTVRET